LAVAACGGPPVPDATTAGGDGVAATEVAGGLDRPVSLTGDPEDPGRLYVVGQAGVISVVEDGAVRAEPFLDIRELVLTSPKGEFASERGLLSLAFAPDFATSGRFVVFYTDRSGTDVIAEYRVRDGTADPSSAEVLLRIPNASTRHHGGQLQFGPDGRLYASVGDDVMQHGDPQSLDPGDPYGKILALHDGGIWEPVAYGLRNPWRFSFDRRTGDLWIGDVGESAWEEVSRVTAGSGLANLGWPQYEGFHEWGQGEPDGTGELVWPRAEYSHDTGCSVTGGYVYRGEAIAPGSSGASIPTLRTRSGRSWASVSRSPPSARARTASCTSSRAPARCSPSLSVSRSK
jgi:glucose/arabinose dehydrogenase